MHVCGILFEELLSVALVEEKALADEDVDRVEELSGRRSELLREAWAKREGYGEDQLRAHLLAMREAQQRLHKAAEALHSKFCEQQHAARKQTKYFNGDRYLHSEMKRAFYCDTKS